MKFSRGAVVIATSLVLFACGKDERPAERPDAASANVVQLDSAQQRAAALELGAVQSLPADTIYLTGTITFERP